MNKSIMHDSHKVRRTAGIVLILMLAGSLSAQSQEKEPDYVPGSDSIEEHEILRRMERELGQEFTPRTRQLPKKALDAAEKRKNKNEPPRYAVQVVLSDQREVAGQISLTQRALEITESQDGVPVRHQVPLPEIQTIEFSNWQAVGTFAGAEQNAARTVYFPTRCKLVRRDGREIEGQFAAFDWLQLRVMNGPSVGEYHTYFSAAGTDGAASAPADSNSSGEAGDEQPVASDSLGAEVPAGIVRSIRFQSADRTADESQMPQTQGDQQNQQNQNQEAAEDGETGETTAP